MNRRDLLKGNIIVVAITGAIIATDSAIAKFKK
jgi:hypothetical protein